MFKNGKKIFIGTLTLICLLGWSTVFSPKVVNAAPKQINLPQIAGFKAGMDDQRLLHMWLQFGVSNGQDDQKKQKQDNGLHLGQKKQKQDNGLHLGQEKQKVKQNNGQQFFFNIISATADILDLDEQIIIDKLQDGYTLLEIAESYDVSKSSLLAEFKDRIEDTMDDALTAGIINETQAEEMKSKLDEGLVQILGKKFNDSHTFLPAPDDFTATPKSATEIYLDWDSVTDAASYHIYRSTSHFGNYTRIDTVKTTSYTDDDLIDDTTYYYTVQAVNSSGISVYSPVAKATTGVESDSKLDEPDDLTARTESDTEISLNWDSVSGATSYYVYRSTSYSGTYRRVATVVRSRYTDDDLKEDTTYYYKVKAHNSTDTSRYSSIVYATTDED